MGKIFIEYQSENGRIPYSGADICFCLTQYARDYIRKERKNIKDIDINIRDAILVDAINYLGTYGGIDFALYTEDLYDLKVEDEVVDSRCLLTVITNHFSKYIFDENMVESVLRNKHMNNCTKKFDINDGVRVLIDFINYISSRNDYDKRFTVSELYEKNKKQNHNAEMIRLREFLQLTSKYCERLMTEENIYNIYLDIADSHNLKFITPKGEYYHKDTEYINGQYINRKMYSYEKRDIDKDLYALAYACNKMNKTNIDTDIIVKKMLEMKK